MKLFNPFTLFKNKLPYTPFEAEQEENEGKGFTYKGKKFIHHSGLELGNTAFFRLTKAQGFWIFILFIALTIGFVLNWHFAVTLFVGALTLFYFVDLLFNMFLIVRSLSKPVELKISKRNIEEFDVAQWPVYTILCPLYKEWQVVPQFISAINALVYPKSKLQVILVLEEEDTETIEHIRNISLPSYFEILTVPHSMPKTKPKACNYALRFAKGEFTVIYDAEDIPDPLQLKKAIIAFSKSTKKTICVQAKLNFFNPHMNILTQAFTMEYSLWFDLILTGLQSINAPIPLGGTSNHFRTKDLFTLKGWDSFNVTEDADLGIRLIKRGYTTAIFDSITLEEANSDLFNWISQRSRWIKGYMQTYLVHMRNLNEFTSKDRILHLVTFQLVIGGKILSIFVNPLMWFLTISYFAFRPHVGLFIESFFPPQIYYMGVLSFLVGNFLYVYYYMIGSKKHGHHALVKYALGIPFYWLTMSYAAWIAAYGLLVTPHYWSKTKHGLKLNTDANATVAT